MDADAREILGFLLRWGAGMPQSVEEAFGEEVRVFFERDTVDGCELLTGGTAGGGCRKLFGGGRARDGRHDGRVAWGCYSRCEACHYDHPGMACWKAVRNIICGAAAKGDSDRRSLAYNLSG